MGEGPLLQASEAAVEEEEVAHSWLFVSFNPLAGSCLKVRLGSAMRNVRFSSRDSSLCSAGNLRRDSVQ